MSIGVLLLLVAFQIKAQEPEKFQLSLKEAQELAVQNNWNYKNAELEVQKAKKKVWETTATGLPQINGEASFQHFMNIPTQVVPSNAFGPVPPSAPKFAELNFGLDNSASAGLTATQLIFSGSYIIGLRAAKSFLSASKNGLKKSEIDVREGTARAYYLVLAASENKRILEENMLSAQKILSETKALYNEGLIEVLDVDQLNLTVANLQANIDHASTSLRTAELLLNFNLGLTPNDEVKTKDRLEQFMNLNSLATADGVANVKGHIDYLSIENKERLDFLNWRNEQSRALPSIAAFYNYSQNAFGNEIDLSDNVNTAGDRNWYPTQIVGLKLTMPIFTSFRGGARMSQAKLTLEQTKNQKAMIEQSLLLNAASSKADYINAMKQYDNAKASESLAKAIYERMAIKYKEGLVSSFELNQSKAQQLQAQGTYINSIMNVLSAKLKLDKAYSNI